MTDTPIAKRDQNPLGRIPVSAAAALQPGETPLPPKRSRASRNVLVVVLNAFMSLMVFAALAGSAVWYFGKQKFEEPGPLVATRSVVISEGASLARIATQLESAGVIDNEFIFRMGVRAHRSAAELKAGEYAFLPNASMYDVMEAIRSGKGITYKITFPEGLTVQQIFERLAENDVLLGDLPKELPPEGSLLPDTFPFQRGATRQEIVNQMQRSQQQLLNRIWANRVKDLPISSPEELITLASIVEKETGRADERPRVAAVFANRLKLGMRLQSDPTIIYGLFGGAGKPADRPIYKSDIEKATPYNTYIIDGLPPGPIANPGRAAMEAVANPSRTEELFFVADGTGGHVFAKTLEEHEENVRNWRAIEKRLKEEADKRAAAQKALQDAAAKQSETTAAEEQAKTASGETGETVAPKN